MTRALCARLWGRLRVARLGTAVILDGLGRFTPRMALRIEMGEEAGATSTGLFRDAWKHSTLRLDPGKFRWEYRVERKGRPVGEHGRPGAFALLAPGGVFTTGAVPTSMAI